MTQQNIHEMLRTQGWYHGENYSEYDRTELLDGLGKVNMVTQVTPNPASRSMVTSRKAIGPHTDHHRADYILWNCLNQSPFGGESILIDSWAILDRMTDQEKRALESVLLMEHRVFPDDSERHPMLEKREDGLYRIYYSFWLADKDAPEAFHRFRSLVEETTPMVIALKPKDILVIDNRRMLHARGAISEDSTRHLVRYWIEKK